jgi:hypothetical protein
MANILIVTSHGLHILKLTCTSATEFANGRTHVFSVIEAFKGYDNTLGVFAGNEVINDDQSAAVSPRYQKAVVRDMKDYIANHVGRSIPVGYSAADDLKVTFQILN